jgi:hypothetical protein
MVVVVYRKSERSKTKYMTVFLNEQNPDRIINGRARKPLIPDEYIIDEIGVGESFINEYKKHHKIKKHESVE